MSPEFNDTLITGALIELVVVMTALGGGTVIWLGLQAIRLLKEDPITRLANYILSRGATPGRPYPVLCQECKYSVPEEDRIWSLKCSHAVVTANSSYAVSSVSKNAGRTNCSDARKDEWKKPCGIKGKLWEPKAPEDLGDSHPP